MVLESLLELVETLRGRIDEHGQALRQSEALTRATLIDPLLRELGWDTQDPALVMPEYKLGAGIADYALLSSGKPVMMIEAKRLNANLQSAASQGITYCITDGIEYFTVTDGRRWEIYETHRPVPINEKMVVSFDVQGMAAAEVCLQALALWRHSVESGHVSAAHSPMIEVVPGEELPTTEVPPFQANRMDSARNVPRSRDNNENWLRISEYLPMKEDVLTTEMMFPDGNTVQIKFLYELMTETVRWLYENDHITQSNPHVQVNRTFIVSDSSVRPNGEEMRQVKSVGPLHVETWGQRDTLIKRIRGVIAEKGLNPSQFKVRMP